MIIELDAQGIKEAQAKLLSLGIRIESEYWEENYVEWRATVDHIHTFYFYRYGSREIIVEDEFSRGYSVWTEIYLVQLAIGEYDSPIKEAEAKGDIKQWAYLTRERYNLLCSFNFNVIGYFAQVPRD